jgi:hypothetical protein
MKVIPFNQLEIELALSISKKIKWKPKSSDWFLNFNNLKVTYTGEYEQSISLCLVLDEDGRSLSFLELIIDGEENGNRMKQSLSYNEKDTFSNMIWLPSIKDCIDIINSSDYDFYSLEFSEKINYVNIIHNGSKYSFSGETELIAFYNCINSIKDIS